MRVAVLGLGAMSTPIAERLEQAGSLRAVWNRSAAPAEPFAARGVLVLPRPADALAQADVALTMLADDAAVKTVTLGDDGVLPDAGGGVLIDMSTISARASAELAERCREAGGRLPAGPVTGDPTVVVAGNLGIIVSGPEDEFERLSGMLRQIGPNLFYVGTAEQARIVKLALNLMLGGTAQLLAEALVLSERHGLDRAKMLEVIGGSAIGSPYVKYKTQALVQEDYSSTFTARMLHKDLTMTLDAGHDVGAAGADGGDAATGRGLHRRGAG